MFIGREKELKALSAELSTWKKKTAVLIYGKRRVGKTTLINYISTFFKDYSRLYLAHTNPAVNNLKRKVSASSNCTFMTITKFNNKCAKKLKRDYDILIIDECSTVSNKKMKELLILFVQITVISQSISQEIPQIGNILSREKISLNGKWNYIVDVQEEGYYDYRMNPIRI